MSSSSDYKARSQQSQRGTRALLPARLLVTTTYGCRLLAAAARAKFMVYGPHIAGLILQLLCLELDLLVLIWRIFAIGCIY